MDIKEKKKKITKRKVFTFCIIAIPVIFITQTSHMDFSYAP